MQAIVAVTKNIKVEISDYTFLGLLADVLERTFDFNPSNEFIEKGYICYEVKYHSCSTERRRRATETDRRVKEIYLEIVEKLK